jgi:hypothetical protein
MANNVTAQALGAQPKVLNDVSTVGDIISQLELDNPSVKVNGQTKESDYTLSDFDFVSFGAKVKGGNK